MTATVDLGFAAGLAAHGDRVALVSPDGTAIGYRQLDDRVSAAAERLGPVRRLVLLAVRNDVDSLVAYLAALRGGHPVLLAGSGQTAAPTAAYDPDVVVDGGWTERRDGTAHELHPDLALLLSTSGSTGSPKLVRLSADNLAANAEAIARYLDIRATDRAITSLPMHYCYGLSVVNSNLLRGAALVLTDKSVVDPAFWTLAREHRVTSLHGVPHTFDLLDSTGFERVELPSLRYVTQAGGRMAPARVRRFAELGEARGWRLVVMYGQTEATARMAYLPPELARAHPSTIGVPIPGGEFDIAADGELVYRGPNVMLGYARGPADLALGRTTAELRTGDLARRTPEGLYEVIGRKSRFLKLFGLRVDLDRVEGVLAEEGIEAACAGTDDVLAVAVRGSARRAGEVVRTAFGLPAGSVRVRRVDAIPRLANGKVDYLAVKDLAVKDPAGARQAKCAEAGGTQAGRAEVGRAEAGCAEVGCAEVGCAEVGGWEAGRTAASRTDDAGPEARGSVRQVFASVLGVGHVPDDATFVDLGGDSLSYVQVSVALQRVLGDLPCDWPTTTVAELEGRRSAAPRLPAVETNILLRALAIVLVVGSHIEFFDVTGGAHLLLVIAGWNFARFVLPFPARMARSAALVAGPAVLWLAYRAAVTEDVTLVNVLLVNNFVGTGAVGYWFVEVVVHALLAFAVLFAIPAVRRVERSHGFAVALALLGVALLLRTGFADADSFVEQNMTTAGAVWFFVLGWLVQRANTTWRKAVVLALAFALIPGAFDDVARESVVVIGLVLLVAVARIPLPRAVVVVVGLVASASLYIYLTHYAVFPVLAEHLPQSCVVVLSIAAGIAAWRAARWVGSGLNRIARPRFRGVNARITRA